MSISQIITYVIASIIVYLYASMPFSYLIGKIFYGKNILEEGSKNSGGSNLGRVAGKNAFIFGFICDASKGAFCCLIGYLFGVEPAFLILIALLGHGFSIFLNFKGGKGVATACGFVLVYTFWGAIFALTIFTLVLYWKKYVSLASLIAIGCYLIYAIIFQAWWYALLIGILYVGVIILHRKNIIKIKNGTETKITWM